MNISKENSNHHRPASPGPGWLCRETGRDITDRAELKSAARKFIERFGEKAPIQAARRAEELLSFGDYQGRALWQLLLREVDKLLECTRTPDRQTLAED